MNHVLVTKIFLVIGGITSYVTYIKNMNKIKELEISNKLLNITIEKMQYENKKLKNFQLSYNKLNDKLNDNENSLKLSYDKLSFNLIDIPEDNLVKSDSSDSFEELDKNYQDSSLDSSVETSIDSLILSDLSELPIDSVEISSNDL